jgi:hypothetical protein
MEMIEIDARTRDTSDARSIDAHPREQFRVVGVLNQDNPARKQKPKGAAQHSLDRACPIASGSKQPSHACQSIHNVRNAGKARRQTTVRYWLHRDVMDKIRTLLAIDACQTPERLELTHDIHPAALDFKRDEAKSGVTNHAAVIAHAREHGHLKPGHLGGLCQRQPVRAEVPVLGHEIKEFWTAH